MKNVMISCGLLVLSLLGADALANAPTSTPLWGCALDALVTKDDGFTVFIRKIDIQATGVMTCRSATGRLSSQNVFVTLKGAGIGPEIAGHVHRIRLTSGKAGISSPEGMYGEYALEAGANVTLFGERLGAFPKLEVSPGEELAGGIQVAFEDVQGLGFDVSAETLTIAPMTKRHRK
jgi:hypothetical protein